MADFALGLTKTAVEGTLSRVQSAIDEEKKLKAAAQQDLVYITGEFQMMQAFLKVANKERADNEVVKTWVRQLRDLAFEVEDCVEYVIHLDNNSAWAWLWRLVPSFMAPPRTRDLDNAVVELKLLKARVEEVSQRNTRYNLISDSGSTPTVPAAQLIAAAGPSTVDILTELWKANMKQSGFCDLRDLITMRGTDRKVITMWRSAGAEHAAAHIITTAYCEQTITQEFDLHARMKLTHPFNLDEFLRSLLSQLYLSTDKERCPEDLRTMESHHIQQKLRDLLGQYRYLIIIEDLPSSAEWDFIKLSLPDSFNGSRVIISTEQLGAALSCTYQPYLVSELRQFADDRYLHVFFTKGHISIAELFRKLGKHRVISLVDIGGGTSSLVRDLYDNMKQKDGGFKGGKFDEFRWLDVTDPFSLEAIYHPLMNNTNSQGLKIDESILLDISNNHRNIARLVVINGLNSIEDWNLIKDTLVPEGTKSCIIIISEVGYMVPYCEDDSPRASNEERNEANATISPFTEASIPIAELFRQLGLYSVISFWGAEGDISSRVRNVYNALLRIQYANWKRLNFKKFCWIDVARPFNVNALYEGLCGVFEKANDMHRKLRQDLRDMACLVVINGLQSREEWDSIKLSFVPEGTKSCIVIISNEEDVATYCQNDSPREIDEEQMEANAAIRPFTEDDYFYVYTSSGNAPRSHSSFRAYRPDDPHIFFSKRIQDASGVPFVPSQNSVRADIYNYAVDDLGVHAVWGTTGVGKSAIVKCYYYAEIGYSLGMTESDDIPVRFWLNNLAFPPHRGEELVYKRFGWVDVPDPFDLEEFSRRLFLDFHSLDPEEMEATAVGLIQGHDPIQGCYEILRKGKYLVVIDGLKSTHDWDMIREAFFLYQPVADTESSVIVITIEERVARHCVHKEKRPKMFNVRALEDNDALDLYQKIANDNKKLTGRKLEDALRILPKCGGLPKIIAAVAQASSSFWENTNDELVVKLQADPQFHHLRGLLSWMHSYFESCPDSLKPCIFYLSVFPTNWKIRRGRLLRRWISEGYSRDTVGGTAMESARRVFSELVDLGILQKPAESAMCQINGFFREYIISQPMEDNLVFVLEGHCKLNSQRTGQHLTIMESWDREETVFGSIDVSRLRSLTVFGKWKSFFISDKMKRIRVLDLEGTLDIKDGGLDDIFRMLLSLKFISLRGCRKLRNLPCSLGGLRQLETLDVSGTFIVTLPPAIIKLQKIQCIRAGAADEGWTPTPTEDDDGMVTGQPSAATPPKGSDGMTTSPPQAGTSPEDRRPIQPKVGSPASRLSCSMLRKSQHGRPPHNGGIEVPVGIEIMPSLQTLGVVNASSARGRDFLSGLGKFTQLLKLRVCGINKENWKQLCSGLSHHGHLECLSVRFDEECMDDSFQPPKTLKSLKLYGPISKLSVHIKDLVNLKKMDLEMTISKTEDMQLFIESLANGFILRRVCIKPTQDVRKLDLNKLDYKMVPGVLKIDCSSSLEVDFGTVWIHDCVHVLILRCSSGSSLLVSGLEQVVHLKVVCLEGFYSDDLKEYMQQEVLRHGNKPVLKLVQRPSS